MSTPNDKANETPNPSQPSDQRTGRRSFFKGALAGGLLGALLATGATVYAQWGGRFCHAHYGGGMSDPAAMSERLEFGSDWVLTKIGASDEQKTRVRAIVHAAVADLAPLHQQHRANRDRMRDALSKPEIDKAALEELRTAELKLADQASVRIQQAVIAAAEVLTPEQRQALIQRMEERRRRHTQS